MKQNKEKIEFWLHSNQKQALKKISDETGYTVSELMRRGVEHIIKDLIPHLSLHNNPDVPFKRKDDDVKN